MFAFLLVACATTPELEAPAPTDWFYADQGEAIDWASIDYDAHGNLIFRTMGPGLQSGPINAPWAGNLACGAGTRLTLSFADSELVGIATAPGNPCVAEIVARIDWTALDLDGISLYQMQRALVVLDVPGEEVAWSSS